MFILPVGSLIQPLNHMMWREMNDKMYLIIYFENTGTVYHTCCMHCWHFCWNSFSFCNTVELHAYPEERFKYFKI